MRHIIATIVASAMLAGTSFAAETAIAWGYNKYGQCDVPAGETFVQVAAGDIHTIGLREDGTVIGWGHNLDGQCDAPAGETFVQIAAGDYHSVGLREDGTAIAWGHNKDGQCNVPPGDTFVQVAGGYAHTIGLREDGTAVAWGNNYYGQCDVPADGIFTQVVAGNYHTIGLREDGTAIAWGGNTEGQCNAPANEIFIQVTAGAYHSIGLRADGMAIAWGYNNSGQCNVPNGETFVFVVGGYYHSIGLRADGTVIAWGSNSNGEGNVPAGELFAQVSGGSYHTIGLRSQQDSDGDGVPDDIDNCYLYNPDQADCNENGIGDVCDVADQTSYDCNQNNVPDECESDCDGDGLIDDCDNDPDIDGDGIPDNCEEDCQPNNLPDHWEIEIGLVTDCNGNLVPDECDLADDPSLDCDGNGLFDACEIEEDPALDCNENGVLDSCDLMEANQWIDEAKLLASDGSANDRFGYSVSISGNTAVFGAVDDDQMGTFAGSAYVYQFNGIEWVQAAKLMPSDSQSGDQFGYSVSIDGDLVIIGARDVWSPDKDAGAAYIYRFDNDQWIEEAKLVAGDAAVGDRFGHSVSISGDTAVIGSPWDDDGDSNSGSAYVFRRDGTQWTQEAKILASNGATNGLFGYSVSISGDTAVIGSPDDDDVGSLSGSAYVFRRDGTQWTQEAKLLASDGEAGDQFGLTVSISDDTAVIGARHDEDNGSDSGSAYVFRRDGTQWTQEAKLLASDGEAGDEFAYSVSISGDMALIGAFYDDDNGTSSGSAYVFRFVEGAWKQEAKLFASDGASWDLFGYSVSISGDTALIGVYGDDDNGSDSGSAYVFAVGSDEDCDGNGLLDSCEIEDDPSLDCNGDGVLDACQSFDDCNANDIPDECDIANGTSNDANGNGIPDECEDDCNGNGVPDHWDIKTGTSEDCNANGIPDECDIADGTSNDANGNGIPDECEEDCNGNGIPDDWDIKTGGSEDCNGNLIPDECDIAGQGPEGAVQWTVEEGGNGHWYQIALTSDNITWADASSESQANGGHLATLTSSEENDWVHDLTRNSIPGWDSYGPWIGGFQDLDSPDYSEPAGAWAWVTGEAWGFTAWDTDEPNNSFLGVEHWLQMTANPDNTTWNDAPDDMTTYGSGPVVSYVIEWSVGFFSGDCNANGIPDECDIADGTSNDINSDGVPDECQCLADIAGGGDPGDGDGEVNVLDLLAIIGFWGSDGPIGDINFDGTVDVIDLLGVIDAWGNCP